MDSATLDHTGPICCLALLWGLSWIQSLVCEATFHWVAKCLLSISDYRHDRDYEQLPWVNFWIKSLCRQLEKGSRRILKCQAAEFLSPCNWYCLIESLLHFQFVEDQYLIADCLGSCWLLVQCWWFLRNLPSGLVEGNFVTISALQMIIDWSIRPITLDLSCGLKMVFWLLEKFAAQLWPLFVLLFGASEQGSLSVTHVSLSFALAFTLASCCLFYSASSQKYLSSSSE